MKRFLLLIPVLAIVSWGATAIASQISSINESNYLIDASEKPIKVTPSTPLEIPFSLAHIPQNAKLKISFLVDSKGRCPKTYEPTEIFLNKKRVEELDFLRNYMRGEMVVHIISLPSEIVKLGENLIRIDMGSCQYGKDEMRLYYILLQSEPRGGLK